MSLRRDIHSAFDVIAPPLGGMPERVVQTVLADKRRRRNSTMLLHLRAPLPLVAALVAIALVAAVLVGGRIVQDWNLFRSGNPAGHSQLTSLQQLEARPLSLAYVKSVADCTSGPIDHDTLALGSGPLFMVGYSGAGWTSWGDYGKLVLYTDAQIAGPILVRARDVVTRAVVVFVGSYADGPVVGSDTLNGRLVAHHSELVLSADTAQPATDIVLPSQHKFEWEFTFGFPKFSTLAAAWQVDGEKFTETFVSC